MQIKLPGLSVHMDKIWMVQRQHGKLKISWSLNRASGDGCKAEKRTRKEVWTPAQWWIAFQPEFSTKAFSSPYFATLGTYISVLHKVASSLWPLPYMVVVIIFFFHFVYKLTYTYLQHLAKPGILFLREVTGLVSWVFGNLYLTWFLAMSERMWVVRDWLIPIRCSNDL